MTRHHFVSFAPFIIFILLMMGLGYAIHIQNAPDVSPPLLNKPAPSLAVQSLNNDETIIATDDLAGNGTQLINFFASWCGPCLTEMPILNDIAKDGVPIMGITFRDDPTAAMAFLTQTGNPFIRVGNDNQQVAAKDWGVSSVPVTFVVDNNGVIQYVHNGPLTTKIYKRVIKPRMTAIKAAMATQPALITE